MKRRRRAPEQIIARLREAEIARSKGQSVPRVARKLGVTMQDFYRWRKEYGGLSVDQAKRLKQLEQENARLKKLVGDFSRDNVMRRKIAEEEF